MNQHPSDPLCSASIGIAAQRAQAELDLVAAIMANPAEGAIVAKDAGLKIEDFDAEDLQAIVNALRVKISLKRLSGDRDQDQLAVARLARDGLRMFGYWDPTQIAGNFGSSLWSNESLAVLFDDLHHPVRITNLIHQLHRIKHREREAEAAYQRCLAMLEGDDELEEQANPQSTEQEKAVAA